MKEEGGTLSTRVRHTVARMPMSKTNQRRRAGFTLVELLVVIVIILVLLAILAPSFQGVRKSARMATCASNLHQIGSAFFAYKQDSKVSAKFPLDMLWPGVPGKWVNEWDLFMCPEDPTPGGRGAALEFHSNQYGFSTAFAPGPGCKVRHGPLAPDGKLQYTPEGCTDYGFEDIATSAGTGGGGDADFDDCVVRIWEAEHRGEIIWTTTVFTNSIYSYGREILRIPPSMGGPRSGLPFPVPDGYTNYGYNSLMGNPRSGATVVALDFGKANANVPGEVMDPYLKAGIRHFDKANTLYVDSSVQPKTYSQLDPTLSANQEQWGKNQ